MKKIVFIIIILSANIISYADEAYADLNITLKVDPINLIEIDFAITSLDLEPSKETLVNGVWVVQGESRLSFITNGLRQNLVARLFNPILDDNLYIEARIVVNGIGSGNVNVIDQWVRLSDRPVTLLSNVSNAHCSRCLLLYRIIARPGINSMENNNKIILEFER